MRIRVRVRNKDRRYIKGTQDNRHDRIDTRQEKKKRKKETMQKKEVEKASKQSSARERVAKGQDKENQR